MRRGILARLHGNGNLIAAARHAGKSLSGPDRRIIARARDEALVAGYADSTIRAIEMEGERGLRGAMHHPIEARYIGSQEMESFGLSVRLYNIEGDHTLNNSTVGVTTLVHNGIFPVDLSFFGVAREYAKENLIVGWWFALSLWQVVKIKLHLEGRP